MSTTIILEAKQLCKSYQMGKANQTQVLQNVDISIKQGAFISVMGPSGSGKSTLLYNISGMDRATSGTIRFDGKIINELSEDALSDLRLERMGFIFQQSNLLKNLNILDNIILPAYTLGKESRQDIRDKALKLMAQTDIAPLADNDITQASGGQLQRAAICRALINSPDIIFGDEPTGALNSKATEQVMDILTDINQRGTTIMLVTHNAKVAAQTDCVLYMADGVIAGEIKLGKYREKDSLKAREKRLTDWLMKMEF